MIPPMRLPLRLAVLIAAVPAALVAQTAKDLPLKYVGPPTRTEISAGDLMTRLYLFADDSMMGRAVGTEYNNKGTAYIESEVRRLGLTPAGDSGTYFQNLPLFVRSIDTATSTLTVGGQVFKAGVDFMATANGRPLPVVDADVVFGGTAIDTTNLLPNESVRGKFVVLRPFMPGPGFSPQVLIATNGYKQYVKAMEGARFVTLTGDQFNANAIRVALNPTNVSFVRNQDAPVSFTITTNVAEALFGGPITTLTKGAPGKTVSATVNFTNVPKQVGRNVVAILPGSDAKLRGQYVAIGAHNDHIGFNTRPADHDSVKAFMQLLRPQGADNPPVTPTPEQVEQVRVLTDSLRALHGARMDSIYNGADDDGSGSVSVLEIAEAFATGRVKPKRSLIFVWHAGEERGLWGAEYFTDHPTVPRDSIVAQLNMDMVGRGRATDATGSLKEGGIIHGGPGYLQLVGSRRLSTELGNLMETVNADGKFGLQFDYAIDADGHPQNIYCRSDHYEYARYGIPIVFMTTGGHADYHQVTDEPQYIDYEHMAQIDKFVFAAAVKIANLDHRVVADKPKPDPKGACVQ